jgi:nicotinate-nucleotide adenylyltransferase
MPLANNARIGIFGGTFDPIHLGHLILAEEARAQLKLDAIYFVPAGDPPHKQDRNVTWVEHRMRMVELATAESDYFWVSRVDADRNGPHYTVDMLRLLQEQLTTQAELYFLMGLDSLRDLPHWHNPHWLVSQCRLVALSRHAVTLDWPTLEAALPGLCQQVIILDMPEIEISSSDLRLRVQAGRPIRYQVPRPVEAYIYKYELYKVTSDG